MKRAEGRRQRAKSTSKGQRESTMRRRTRFTSPDSSDRRIRQALRRIDIAGEDARRVGRRNSFTPASCDDLLDAVGDGEQPFDVAGRGAAIVRRVSIKARDVLQQCRPGRRRWTMSTASASAPSACFHEGLPQVQQMAARLHLARLPQVGGFDAHAVERLSPETTMWSAMMALNSKGNTSSDRANSSAASRSGVASPTSCHPAQARRAGAEVVGRQRIDHRQDVEGAVLRRRVHCLVTVAGARCSAAAQDAVFRRPIAAGAERSSRRSPSSVRAAAGLAHMQYYVAHATPRVECRLLRRRHRDAERARRPEKQPLAARQRRRDDVRQRR